MERSLDGSNLKKNWRTAITVASVLAVTLCLNPDSALAQVKKKCSFINPCPRLSGSPNSGQIILDFDIDFSDLNSSTGLFPDVIQNAKYTACVPFGDDIKSGCPTFSVFFDPSYLIASSLPDDNSRFSGGTVYETVAQDQNSNFLKFSIFLPPTSNDPLHSLLDLQNFIEEEKLVLLSSSSLNNPLPPSSSGVLPIKLIGFSGTPTDVPENPTSILLGTGILGSILFLKRMKRSR